MPQVTSQILIPAINCWVAPVSADSALGEQRARGLVTAHSPDTESPIVQVRWSNRAEPTWHHVTDLKNGFTIGDVVQDKPTSNTRTTIGTGIVLAERHIAGKDMVLVQLHESGESRWFPYEHLVALRGTLTRYMRAEQDEPNGGEKLRLKMLAHALDTWNQITGALDRLDVDPLPHQIGLVHRIMTSDQSNWLIADDVGLGKTIEVGLLLAAMRRRRQARRVLVVCPAALVRQWQDEMNHKFNEDFRIFGHDFSINQPSQWALFDKVIVSIDRAKSDKNIPSFAESGEWDVIVFDEAHHLSRMEHQVATQRYRLAYQLRAQTDALIFLTGTPHQGNNSQFVHVLNLLRPDLQKQLENVFTEPSLVAEVVLRNRKSLATDINGEFLFRGQDTHKMVIPLTGSVHAFDRELRAYLRQGYTASAAAGVPGRAIGFVMTTYRKLASSSIPAIQRALLRRKDRLDGLEVPNVFGQQGTMQLTAEDIADAYENGSDGDDNIADVAHAIAQQAPGRAAFFDGERERIGRLLQFANDANRDDQKMRQFLDEIVAPVHGQGERLLIFTEYRATQDYIVEQLQRAYPNVGVVQINGSMSLDEKRKSIATFNEHARFIVSTEAGGEGINLHENCHILVNYDLPWNPTRLVQRSGRLYRYGQRQRVSVFNLLSNDGFDNIVLNRTLERVETIARDMAAVSQEFGDRNLLQTEIIGELLERVDIASLLAATTEMDISRSEKDVDEAIERAKEAKKQQDQLFSNVEGYDPSAVAALYPFGADDVLAFVEGILPFRSIDVRNRLHDGRVLEIRLPDELRGKYSDFPVGATIMRVTADRDLARRLPNVHSMDFKSRFFVDLIEWAQSPSFKGEYASIRGPEGGTLGLFKLRWQNDQGVPREEALLPVFLPLGTTRPTRNPEFLGNLLRVPSISINSQIGSQMAGRHAVARILQVAAEAELAERCTRFRHPNDIILLATADLHPHS